MSRLLSEQEAEEFKKLLQDYELNEAVLTQFMASNFAVIAGPAGAGKDTLRNELISRYPESYLPILSTTTRPPRPGEQDAVTYHFREIEQVRQGLINKDFFQAELVHGQQVSCLDISEIKKLRPDQWGLSILITETENKLHDIKNSIRVIFLIPPSYDELISRIQSERMLDENEINRRLTAAEKEIEYALKSTHYVCLVSDTVDSVVNVSNDYLQEGIQPDDTDARNIMRDVLKKVRERKQ